MVYISRKFVCLIIIIIVVTLAANLRLAAIEIVKKPSLIISGLLSSFRDISRYTALKNENDRLKSTISVLTAQLAAFKEDVAENDRLRALLNFKKASSYSLIVARVVGRSPSVSEEIILIDKGSNEGLAPDMPVITISGLAGRINKTSRDVSWVTLVNDPNFRASCIARRSREPGLLQGRGGALCVMGYLPDDADIVPGDEIITSGLGGIFPKGLSVGRVIKVYDKAGQRFKQALVKPDVNLRLIEEVLIIADKKL